MPKQNGYFTKQRRLLILQGRGNIGDAMLFSFGDASLPCLDATATLFKL